MDTPNKIESSEGGAHKERINRGFWELVSGISDFLRDMFELESDLDREGTIANIQNNKRMRGANVWLLICSIMVASIGLDLNSGAVIIGAMLISPLMSPILGIGLGVAINDRKTLYISLQHFGIAVVIALITSIIYFYITPYGVMTTEMEGRTAPTFLDAMIAVFGGVAGIVSSSRKDKSNAIPGVAIATALMPPLCVAGYGIAYGELDIFLNSFYLFFLNSAFIAITTFLVVRFLRFPYVSYLNKRDKSRTQFILALFSIIVLIPSVFILSRTVRDLQAKQQIKDKLIVIDNYIKKEFDSPYKNCVDFDTRLSDSINYITINYYSKDDIIIPPDSIEYYKKGLQKAGITNPIVITRGRHLGILPDKKEGEQLDDYNRRLAELARREEVNNRRMMKEQMRADSIRQEKELRSLVKEAKVFVPNLNDIDLVESKFDTVPVLLINWKNKEDGNSEDIEKLKKFVQLKTSLDTLVVVKW